MRVQTEIARQQLEIIAYQEKDRRKENDKAYLKAQLAMKYISERENMFILDVKNVGKAKARDIRILIDGKPAYEYPPIGYLIRKKDIPSELGPGTTWSPQLLYTVGIEAKFDIKIEWQDDSGELGSFEQRLIPVASP